MDVIQKYCFALETPVTYWPPWLGTSFSTYWKKFPHIMKNSSGSKPSQLLETLVDSSSILLFTSPCIVVFRILFYLDMSQIILPIFVLLDTEILNQFNK